MKKPLVVNRLLTKKWKDYETDLLNKKIVLAKPTTSITKNRVSKSEVGNNRVKKDHITETKENELNKNNDIMPNILKFDFGQNYKKAFSINKNLASHNNKKWEIFKIAKENQSILKRINESTSSYKREIFEKDYRKREKYMTNICEFPMLNFNPNYRNNTLTNIINKSKNRPRTQSKFKCPYNINQTEEVKNSTQSTFYKPLEKINEKEEKVFIKEETFAQNILYKKLAEVKNLGICDVIFYIENKGYVCFDSRFKIKIIFENKTFIIEINKIEDVLKMQNLYTNYDQIIENLIFFNDEVNLIQNINIFIEYKTLKFTKESQ